MAYSKESQARYRKKCINFAVKYTPKEDDGQRLKEYLQDTGQTANSYIKSLIKQDLDQKGV